MTNLEEGARRNGSHPRWNMWGRICLSGRGAGESLGRKLIKEFKQGEAEGSLAVFVFEAAFLLSLTMISLEQLIWTSAETLPGPSPVSLIIAAARLLKTHRLALASPLIYTLQGFAEQLMDSPRPRTKVFKDSGSFVPWCELQKCMLEFFMAAGHTCGLVVLFHMCFTCWFFFTWSVWTGKCAENVHCCGTVHGLCHDFIQVEDVSLRGKQVRGKKSTFYQVLWFNDKERAAAYLFIFVDNFLWILIFSFILVIVFFIIIYFNISMLID